MTETRCPVDRILSEIRSAMESGSLNQPRVHRIAEQLEELIADIAWGRAGHDHLTAIYELLDEWLGLGEEAAGAALAKQLSAGIDTHREVFESHVKTHNCATGDCVKLAPAPCQMTCPAGIDVPTYLALIGQGKDAEAVAVIRRDNPLPWVCGLVCTRPCEFMCVRSRIDTPIAIKTLKAFAAERAMSVGSYVNPPQEPPNGRKVCIIGAGPGGLSAAYYLALKGYTVRVIEALPMAGGMLMVGIPRYRLPREVIDREVALIESLGVEFCYNTRFGSDVTLDQLRKEGFEAFFFAIGAHSAYKLGIPGEDDYPQVIEAISLLKRVALGERHKPGESIIVIGGGNVAIDAARTCLRLGCQSVTIAYRRTRVEMPADVEEVEQAEEEGVHFAFLTIPKQVVGKDGKVTGLECVRAQLVERPGSKRKSPVPILGGEFIMPADTIVAAIGQRVDYEALERVKGLKWTRRDTIKVNTATMATSREGIFAAGDAVTGPATVIEAIGGGKRAALAIDRYLQGIPQPELPPVPVRRGRIEWTEIPASTKMVLKRPDMPLLTIDRRRTTFQQVELGFSENQVREEARRCLRCDICRRCGKCVEVCRDHMGIDALELGYMEFEHPSETDFRRTEEKCIACGACAANCPNDAMRIIDRGDERILSLCGTILNRQKLVFCSSCGKVIGPQRYLDFIRKRVDDIGRLPDGQVLCEVCSRNHSAKVHTDTMPV